MSEAIVAKNINIAVRIGLGLCLLSCVTIILVMVIFPSGLSGVVRAITFFLLWLGLGIGIYKKSRICAAMAIVCYMFDQLFIVSGQGYTRFNVLWVVVIPGFTFALVACWQYHQIIKEESVVGKKIRKPALIISVLMLAVFFGVGLPLANKIHSHKAQKQWEQYVQITTQEITSLKLPQQVEKNVLLTQVGFEDKTLVFTYDAQDLKNIASQGWDKKTREDFARFCRHAVPQSLGLQVLYRLTQGNDKREFEYGARDCQNMSF
ncbi:hypothetical protein [Klebsiella spallanzanii]|uniref:hypothetical protein n=1 Tax=Klebsiella spallanzanii TaxID=2587528 RepID=UPI00111AA43D|nr:hypothetical protein [Klebsiella spallanzanii]